jgi:hypothetical protein
MEFNYAFLPDVFNFLKEEWKSSNTLYSKFIQDKNIGLETNHELLMAESRWGLDVYTDFYKIIDEKKWTLNRIKYGI